jgi:hypothetical protein
MGLNIVSTGGDFDPYAKYNAKSGRWYYKNGDDEVEVADPKFVPDFENIKTGWMLFLEGQAPDRVMDKDLSTPADKPSDQHKRGFLLRLFSPKSFNGIVELSATSMHLCNAMNSLYEEYEAGKATNAGKLPVVKFTGSTPSKDKFGTNYKPNFEIDGWVDRPEEFDNKPANDAQPAPAPQASVSEF